MNVYKHTEETKRKIKEARKKQVIKHSEETKRKIGLGNKGKKLSEETKNKIRIANLGEKSSNWKGGISKKPDYQKNRIKNLRQLVLEELGDKCNRCGFYDYRALQIDHINGGGSKELRKINFHQGSYLKNVLKSILNKENKYQLLCANCNWIKKYEKNEK